MNAGIGTQSMSMLLRENHLAIMDEYDAKACFVCVALVVTYIALFISMESEDIKSVSRVGMMLYAQPRTEANPRLLLYSDHAQVWRRRCQIYESAGDRNAAGEGENTQRGSLVAEISLGVLGRLPLCGQHD